MIEELVVERAAVSFEEFFVAAEPRLRRALVGGFGGELGREATAEALAYGWEHWERVRSMANPSGYLYRVGERWAVRQRSRHRRQEAYAADAGGGSPPEFEPGLETALAGLSRRQRQVVVLVVGFGVTHAETGELLGLSRSSVQNHLERGLRHLRSKLGVS